MVAIRWRKIAMYAVISGLMIAPSGPALGDSTGERPPTSEAGAFTNAANAQACGGGTATADANNQTETYSVYGLSLPNTLPAPVVTGIQVRVRANDSTKNNRKLKVSLSWNAGTTFSDIFGVGIGLLQTKNFRRNQPLKDYILGGATFLWGRTWSASDLSDANFRLKVLAPRANSPDPVNLDCIPVTVFYTIPGAPSLDVSKTASPDPVGPTGNLTYTLTYGNTGQSTATNTIISDVTPLDTTFVSASPAPTSAPAVGQAGTVTWNVGSLPVGGSGVVTLVVKVSASIGSTIDNTAYSIKSDQNAPTFGNPVSTSVANAVLTLSKSASPNPVAPGGSLTYTLILHNGGSVTASNVVVNEGYDPNGVYSSDSTSPSGCATFQGAPDNDQWTINSFAAGATCTITIVTTVATPLADGVILLNNADAGDDAGDSASAGAFSVVNQCAGQSDGSSCNDGNACTTTDTCSNQACAGGPPPNCDDGDVCTNDSCNFTSGCTHVNNTAPCDDSNDCTTTDTCSGGACIPGPALDCDDHNGCTDDSCNPNSGCAYVNNNNSCDDGDACTTNDACSGGICLSGAALDCNDHNVCTDDGCNPASGCTYMNNTASCDDSDACTTGDVCSGGSCAPGGPTNCNDGNVCTGDSCNPATGCAHSGLAGCCNVDTDCNDTDLCTTNERCVDHACVSSPVDCNDTNVCTDDGCNPNTGCTHANNNNSCDDSSACTTDDTCSGGACVGGPPPNCNDNNVCTDDSCDSQTGCTHTNNAASCDDGNACTTTDTCSGGTCVGGPAADCNDNNGCTDDGCNPANGCTHVNNNDPCSDGNACTTNDTCSAGACVGGAPPDCNDSNACTNDSCNAASGCEHVNNNNPCDDGSACTTSDICNGGSCVGGAAPNCDDGNGCTDDSCNSLTGCGHVNNTAACDDGNACTTSDTCSAGGCVGGTALNCNDNNGCTDDGCNPASGCTHVNNNDPCSDGNACTTADACSGGACVGGPAPNCNDGNVCTDDSCNPQTGCEYVNNTAPCSDGNACTTGDTCSGGSCGPGGPTDCNDNNVCTGDSCNPATGCTHSGLAGCCNVDADCGDSDQCTTNERCVAHACVSDPVNCNDTNGCTDDSCNPASGCVHTNNTAPCNDSNACTTGDTCSGGSCVGGAPPNCNDNNVCTTDGCNTATGCTHVNNTNSCDDGNACTTSDTCSGGSCVGGAPPNCNDSNVCTTDGCNPASGCTHANNTNSCDDGNACTTTDTCSGGSCVGGAPPNCNDNNPCTTDGCNPASGCSNLANNNACNDSNACTTADACSSGACVGGAPPDCNDNNVCTNDSCNVSTGCQTTNNTAPCSDGNTCTQTDTCQNGTCSGSNPVICTALNQCHLAGTCDTGNGSCSNPSKADNTQCNDQNSQTCQDVCTAGTCAGTSSPICLASQGICTLVPMTGCRNPTKPRSSLLLLRSNSDATRNFALWLWNRGAATDKTAFGDPVNSTVNNLCVYSEVAVGVPNLVMTASVPALGDCNNRQPCWRNTRSGYFFLDRTASTAGIRAIYQIGGAAGKARIIVLARGSHLSLPSFPLSQNLKVTMQLQNSSGECWEGQYSAPALVNRLRGTNGLFIDRGD